MSCQELGPWLKGTRPTIEYNFTNAVTDEAEDPASIVVITRDPSGDELGYDESDPEVYQAIVPVTGQWFFTFPVNLTETGIWFVYANGDGGVREVSFKIVGVHVTV